MEKIRHYFLNEIREDLNIVPVCAILGPRQCGKTTLARQYASNFSGRVHYFDMEDPADLAKLETPKLTLETLEGLIIIDEVQRRPELFPYLRVLVDKKDIKLLILGSASRELLQQSSESLAGRINYLELPPFGIKEVDDWKLLWVRGGFPRSLLANSDKASSRWRQTYIQTYFEHDLVQMGINLSPREMGMLWSFLTQYHGGILNYTEIGRFLGLTVVTVKRYLGLLEGTFMIRTLAPWFENIAKRQVKSPKLYIRDSGIYHQLNNLYSFENLILSSQVGRSWEGFALEEVIKSLNLRTQECYFWSTHQDAELDLFFQFNGKRIGVEFKYSDQPKLTKSMKIALEELKLDYLFIVTPLNEDFLIHDKVRVCDVARVASHIV